MGPVPRQDRHVWEKTPYPQEKHRLVLSRPLRPEGFFSGPRADYVRWQNLLLSLVPQQRPGG